MPAVVRGPATLTIDPAAVGDNTGTLVIAGDLQVDGTTTTINSTTMTVDDKNLVLASGAGNASAADGAGVTIDGASATMLYTHATTSFDFNKPVNIAGNLGVTGTVDGVDIAARDAVLTSTTTTANAALPKSGGTMTGVIAGFESTGIDDNATDTVITVQQNGMVGIGIDGPGARLTLGGTAGAADNSSVMLIALGATQKTYFGTANATGNIITGSSSGDTVLRSNGHNILFSVDSGSSSAVYIKSDGKVGIGETSPLGKLHVKDGDAGSITTNGAHDTIIVEGSANTGINIFSPSTSYQYLAFGDPGGSNRGYVRYQHSIDQMVLRAGGTDTVFINGGNVGIGADSPNEMLHIEATNPKIRLLNNSTGGSGLEWWNDYGGSDHINSSIGWNEGSANWEFKNYRADGQSGSPYGNIDFLNGSTTSPTLTLRIATNNNVAIGHSSPTDKLDVQGADNGITIRSASAHRPKLSLINDSSTMLTLSANGTYAAIGDGADANRYMSFRSGKVGVGDTDPDTALHVAGNVKVGSAASSSWATSIHDAGGLDVVVGSGSHALQLWDDNSQSQPRFEVERAGKVTMGTTIHLHESRYSGAFNVSGSSEAYNLMMPSFYGQGSINQTYRHAYNINTPFHTTLWQGGGGNTVFTTWSKIGAEHYKDIYIETYTLYYSDIKIKVITDNNANISVWYAGATYNNNVYSARWRVYPLQACTLEMNPSSSQSAVHMVHYATGGRQDTSTDTASAGSGPSTW